MHDFLQLRSVRRRAVLVLTLGLGLAAGPLAPAATAQDPADGAWTGEPATAAAEPDWSLDFGLSYLATGGNSDTESMGATIGYQRTWGPWGLAAGFAALRADVDGERTAENLSAMVRGSRDLLPRLALTVGSSALQDEFAGIDLRSVTDVSLRWTFLDGPRFGLAALLGPSWTYEDRLDGDSESSFGAYSQLEGLWNLSPSSALRGRLTYLPNFDESDDYRVEAEIGAEAALSSWLALNLGYLRLYDHQPVPGFQDTDTRTTVSLVLHWGATDEPCPCA